ncbi:UNVERIFIED_CONTAM: hypothetical protein Sradi_7101700 [Sesamum radiatum]|uniref:Uncharacterized protein n=1 Tax=Sesamum radiatum TaxID=300843 RepID=A0AAW2J1F2_SESRA
MAVTVIHQGQWCWPSASDFDIQSIMADLPCDYPLQPDQVLWKQVRSLLSPCFSFFSRLPRVSFGTSCLEASSGYRDMNLFFGLQFWSVFLQWTEYGLLRWANSVYFAGGNRGSLTAISSFTAPFRCCLDFLRRRVRFRWPNRSWHLDIFWAARRWRESIY